MPSFERRTLSTAGLVRAACVASILAAAAVPFSLAQSAITNTGNTKEACRPVSLFRRPGWTISGAWTNDGRDLLMVDTLYNKVIRYSENGLNQGEIPGHAASALENFYPSRIEAGPEGDLLLELASGRMVSLDRRFFPSRRGNILSEGKAGRRITSVFAWDVAGSDLITLSDLRGPGETERLSAFLRIPIEDTSRFTMLKPPPSDTSRSIFRLGYDYMTALGTTAYVLLFDGQPQIYRNTKGSLDLVPLNAFPDGPVFPALPRFTRRDDYPVVMAAVEKSSMPVGLYGWRGELYLLTRRPSGGGTAWSLSRIDPDQDEVIGTVEIPTQANHITVVPGPREWAFVEKGPVRALEDQDTTSILYVPGSRIASIKGNAVVDLCKN